MGPCGNPCPSSVSGGRLSVTMMPKGGVPRGRRSSRPILFLLLILVLGAGVAVGANAVSSDSHTGRVVRQAGQGQPRKSLFRNSVDGPRTRLCGTSPSRGYPIVTRATPNIRCHVAFRIIEDVVDGSARCYSGPARFHPCRLYGFYCTAHFGTADHAMGRCTKGPRELILGQTGNERLTPQSSVRRAHT